MATLEVLHAKSQYGRGKRGPPAIWDQIPPRLFDSGIGHSSVLAALALKVSQCGLRAFAWLNLLCRFVPLVLFVAKLAQCENQLL